MLKFWAPAGCRLIFRNLLRGATREKAQIEVGMNHGERIYAGKYETAGLEIFFDQNTFSRCLSFTKRVKC